MSEPRTLGEFLKWDAPKLVPILGGGLMYQGSKVVLFAQYKAMKSMNAIWFCLKVSSGLPWMGFETPKEGASVLYLQLEIAETQLQRRILKMTQGDTWISKKPMYIWSESSLKLDTKEGFDRLDEVLAKLKPEVVVIDPVYKIMGGKMTDEMSVRPFLDRLDELMMKHNISLLLVHHSRKKGLGDEGAWGSDEMLGSVFFSAWPDTVIKMERTAYDQIQVKFEVVRHAEEEIAPRQFKVDMTDLSFNQQVILLSTPEPKKKKDN